MLFFEIQFHTFEENAKFVKFSYKLGQIKLFRHFNYGKVKEKSHP